MRSIGWRGSVLGLFLSMLICSASAAVSNWDYTVDAQFITTPGSTTYTTGVLGCTLVSTTAIAWGACPNGPAVLGIPGRSGIGISNTPRNGGTLTTNGPAEVANTYTHSNNIVSTAYRTLRKTLLLNNLGLRSEGSGDPFEYFPFVFTIRFVETSNDSANFPCVVSSNVPCADIWVLEGSLNQTILIGGREYIVNFFPDPAPTPMPSAVCAAAYPELPVEEVPECIGFTTAEQEAKALKLKVVQESRILSQITAKLHSYRAIIELKWDKYNLEVQKDLRKESGNENVKSRIMINYSVPLTAFKIINEIEQLPWTYEDMLRAAVDYMTVQHKAIGNDDECTVWWRIVAFCLADRQLEHDKDILVKDVTSITVKSVNIPGMPKTSGDSHTISFEVSKKLLFVRFERSHPLYLEMHKSQHSKQGFGLGALQHYLRFSPAYIGEVKSHRFNGKSKGAWVFDTALLPIELDLSSDFTQRYDGPTVEDEIINNDKHDETPF